MLLLVTGITIDTLETVYGLKVGLQESFTQPSQGLIDNYFTNLTNRPVSVNQTPFGINEQPLTFTNKFIGDRPVYTGGNTGHTNVQSTSLPNQYFIDAGLKGVTLVSKIAEPAKKTSTSGGLFNYDKK